MMLYTFVKKDGDVKRIGGESSVTPELQEIFMSWSEAGWEPAAAEEFDGQVIGAAQAPVIEVPEAPVEAPVEASESEKTEPAQAAE